MNGNFDKAIDYYNRALAENRAVAFITLVLLHICWGNILRVRSISEKQLPKIKILEMLILILLPR